MQRLRRRPSRSSSGMRGPSSTRRSSRHCRLISRGSASSAPRSWPRSSSSDVASPRGVPALAVVVAGAPRLALGGSLGRFAEIRLRAPWLFLAAIALQVVAFPVSGMPWRTHETVASVLWVASCGLLVGRAVLNRQIIGVPVLAAGMCLNLVAILANGGTMPVGYDAMHAAGRAARTDRHPTAPAPPGPP